MDIIPTYKVFKCIVGVHQSGTPYHYFRKVNNLTKSGLYVVEKWTNERDEIIILHNKKEIDLFTDVIETIEILKTQKLRDKKLQQLL
jgi:hypothetical protein